MLPVKAFKKYYSLFLFSPSPFGSKNHTWADSKTVFVVLAQLVVDNNYDDNGILASITLPTADGIKCDYHLPFKNGKW